MFIMNQIAKASGNVNAIIISIAMIIISILLLSAVLKNHLLGLSLITSRSMSGRYPQDSSQ